MTFSEYKPIKDKIQFGKIDGTISGAPKNGVICLSSQRFSVTANSSGAFNLPVLLGKPLDLFITHYMTKDNDPTLKADGYILKRKINPNSTLSLSWSEAAPLVPITVNVADIPKGMALGNTISKFLSADEGAYIAWQGQATSKTGFEYPAIPAKDALPTDGYLLYATASEEFHQVEVQQKTSAAYPDFSHEPSSNAGTAFPLHSLPDPRVLFGSSLENTSITIHLPKTYDPPNPTFAGSSPVRLAFSGIQQNGGFESAITTDKENGLEVQIFASKGWLGGKTAYTMPDLHNLPGWKDSFSLPKEPLLVSFCFIQGDPDLEFVASTKYFSIKP